MELTSSIEETLGVQLKNHFSASPAGWIPMRRRRQTSKLKKAIDFARGLIYKFSVYAEMRKKIRRTFIFANISQNQSEGLAALVASAANSEAGTETAVLFRRKKWGTKEQARPPRARALRARPPRARAGSPGHGAVLKGATQRPVHKSEYLHSPVKPSSLPPGMRGYR
jgi:hypothetical protein